MAVQSIDIGPIILNGDVELAVLQMLRGDDPDGTTGWLAFYLAQIDAERGRQEPTPLPLSWATASEGTRWDEETPPALLVFTPGPTAGPRHGPRASYRATWPVNVGITAGGATESGTRMLANIYAGAVQLALPQHADLGGLAARTSWLGSRSDVLPRNRKMLAAEIALEVEIARVIDTRGLTLPSDPTDPGSTPPVPVGQRIRIERSLPDVT